MRGHKREGTDKLVRLSERKKAMPASFWQQANQVPTSQLKQACNYYEMPPVTVFNLHLVPCSLWMTWLHAFAPRKIYE